MSDRFVEQDTRPTGTEHYGHLPGWRSFGLEVGDRLMHGFLGITLEDFVIKITKVETPTTARRTCLLYTSRCV